MSTPRHASAVATPYRVPARYLTEATQGYPLILLVDSTSLGDAVQGGDDLPVGVGLMLRTDVCVWNPCPDCGATAPVWVQDGEEEGPGDTECLVCLLHEYGSSYGVVPSAVVEWVPTP